MANAIDIEIISGCIKQCQPEVERLMSLKIERLDISRLSEKEKAEIIDAVYSIVCCVMDSYSITDCEQ